MLFPMNTGTTIGVPVYPFQSPDTANVYVAAQRTPPPVVTTKITINWPIERVDAMRPEEV